MHKFYITCRCIQASSIYHTEVGKTYTGEGHINTDGSVDYIIHIPGCPYGHQIYRGEWFGVYFRIESTS